MNLMLGTVMVFRELLVALVATHPDGKAVMAGVLARVNALSEVSLATTLPEATLRGIEAEMRALQLPRQK